MKHKETEGVSGPTKRPRKDKNKYTDLVSVSLVIFLLDKFTDWVYRCLIEGFFGRIFTAYSSEQAAFERGAFCRYFYGSSKAHRYFRRVREFLSERFESSFFIDKLQLGVRRLQSMSLRSLGNFFMSFGAYTMAVYVIRMLLPSFQTADMSFFIVGFVICVVSLPLVTARGSLIYAVGKSRFMRALCVDFFGFREEMFEKKSTRKRGSAWMIFLGMLCGLLTFFVDPLYIPIGAGIFVSVLLIFSAPEIGLLMTLLALPFFSYLPYPTISLSLVVLVTFVSYLFKLIRGKRVFRFELYDFMILLFGVAVYFGGAISAGGTPSYQSALMSCALMLGYFLVVNLIRTKVWLHRCLGALVSSATIVAILGVFQYFFGTLDVATLDLVHFSDIKGRVTVVFGNANMVGFYLAMILPISLYFLFRAKGLGQRLVRLFSVFMMLACIVFTWSRGAWLATLVSLLIFFFIHTRKTIRYLLVVLCSLPILVFWLPDTVVRRFAGIGTVADSSTVYRLYTWQGTWDAITDFFFSGVGYGTEAYTEVYPAYAYAGMETAEHSHSLFLQIWFSIGIAALVVFLFVVLLFLQRSLETLKVSTDETLRAMSAAVLCAVVAILIMGLFDYVWFQYRIFYLFWIALGLSAAISRVDTAERQRDAVLDFSGSNGVSADLNL